MRYLPITFAIIAALTIICFPILARAQSTATGLEGTWQGVISVGGTELHINTEFKKSGEGYTGTFQSVDQNPQVLTLDTVTFKSGVVHFELKIAHAVWDGKLNDRGTELSGTWTQSGHAFPLNYNRGGTITAPKRQQEPHRPYPYVEEEVLYDNKGAGTKIGGTLTLPKSQGPFAAVLLITGSGQQNRDEELLGHKPFLIISDYLTRRGVAVLRVDDRGMGTSTGDFSKATTADFSTDVEAGVAFLKARKDIRHDKIGLIGHSEGGVIAPMVASRNRDVAFIVMLAGTGVDGGKILAAQSELIAKADGATADQIKFNRDLQERSFAVLASEKDPQKAEEKIKAVFTEAIKTLPADKRDALEKALPGSVAALVSPWMRYFITYDPAPALKKLKCSVLVMNGEKDLQVPPKLNLPTIEAALKEGGDTDYTIKLLPGLNHLFQTCQTGSPSEYTKIEETVSPLALQTMGDWIVARSK